MRTTALQRFQPGKASPASVNISRTSPVWYRARKPSTGRTHYRSQRLRGWQPQSAFALVKAIDYLHQLASFAAEVSAVRCRNFLCNHVATCPLFIVRRSWLHQKFYVKQGEYPAPDPVSGGIPDFASRFTYLICIRWIDKISPCIRSYWNQNKIRHVFLPIG